MQRQQMAIQGSAMNNNDQHTDHSQGQGFSFTGVGDTKNPNEVVFHSCVLPF